MKNVAPSEVSLFGVTIRALIAFFFLGVSTQLAAQVVVVDPQNILIENLYIAAEGAEDEPGSAIGKVDSAQTERSVSPLVTDRPTDSLSPVVVPRRSLQVESGYTMRLIDAAAGDINNHVFPELLLRYGLHDRFEARLFVSGWTYAEGPSGTEEAFSDVGLGTKIYLRGEKKLIPQMSFFINVNFPVGSEELTSDYVIPKVLFIGSHTLSERMGLTYNIGPSYVTYKEAGERNSDWDLNYAVALSRSVNDRVSLFAEVYGAYVFGRAEPDRHTVQIGTTILVLPNVQIDFRGGTGLVSNEPEWILGAGISFRLPQ